jgi:hypothetical protein
MLAAAPAPKDAATSTEDWPQWRGPNRDGKSGVKGIIFPKDGPKLAWQNEDIGIGYGQPAVVGNRLYINVGSDRKAGSPEALLCLSLDKGEKIWKEEVGTSAGNFNDSYGGGPRSTPTVTNGHVYVLGSTGDLACFTAEDGKKVWSKSLVRDFGGQIPDWGYSESPLVEDGRVIVTPGKGTGMIALDAKTGKTVWECKEFKDVAGYSSIVPMMLGETKLYIQQTMEAGLAVKAKDGKLAFKGEKMARRTAVIPTPVISSNYVFFTANYRAGCECYQLSLDGDAVKAKKLYSGEKTVTNHHGGVIGLDNHIFGHSDSGGWTCFDFKKEKPEAEWQSSKLGKGSITYADGRFFCYAESSGDLAVIKASTQGWEEVGRMSLPSKSATRPNSGKIWPHPVIAQGKLFLRDYEKFFVFDVKPKS